MHFVRQIKGGQMFPFRYTLSVHIWSGFVPILMVIILHLIIIVSTRFLYLKCIFIILLVIRKYFVRVILWLYKYSIQIPKLTISFSTYFSSLPELFIMMMDCKCWFFWFSSFFIILAGIPLQGTFSFCFLVRLFTSV